MLGELATAPSSANHIVVRYQPIGISLLVTPWNFLGCDGDSQDCSGAGGGLQGPVILKPAAETPLTALAVAQIMREAGCAGWRR